MIVARPVPAGVGFDTIATITARSSAALRAAGVDGCAIRYGSDLGLPERDALLADGRTVVLVQHVERLKRRGLVSERAVDCGAKACPGHQEFTVTSVGLFIRSPARKPRPSGRGGSAVSALRLHVAFDDLQRRAAARHGAVARAPEVRAPQRALHLRQMSGTQPSSRHSLE